LRLRWQASCAFLAKSLYSNSFGLARFNSEKSLSLLNKFLPTFLATNYGHLNRSIHLNASVAWLPVIIRECQPQPFCCCARIVLSCLLDPLKHFCPATSRASEMRSSNAGIFLANRPAKRGRGRPLLKIRSGKLAISDKQTRTKGTTHGASCFDLPLITLHFPRQ